MRFFQRFAAPAFALRWLAPLAMCAVALHGAEPTQLQRWTPAEHGGAPISFAITQSPASGFIYVANAAGLLEFDGTRWRRIAMPGGGAARVVVADPAGGVWAARAGNLARLQPDAHGEMELHPAHDSVASPVHRGFPTRRGVGFVTGTEVLLLEPGGAARRLNAGHAVESAWWTGDAVQVATTDGRLLHAQSDGTWRTLSVRAPRVTADLPGVRQVLAFGASEDGSPLLLTARGPLGWDAGRQIFAPAGRAIEPFGRRVAVAATMLPGGGSVYAFGRGEVFVFDRDGNVTRRISDLRDGSPEVLAADSEGGIWLARPPDILRLQIEPAPARAPAAVVRRLATLRGQALPAPSPSAALTLTAGERSLHAEFAAPTFAPGRLEFRSRIDGHDSDWSEWSPHAERDWTALPRGALLLRVQARRDAGAPGPVVDTVLHVPAPWWLTPGAIAGLLITVTGAVGGIAWFRSHTLRRRAARLEAQVLERTAELAGQNAELRRLRELELDALATARLTEEKTRLEMLRYQLNPHFLYNALNSIYALVRTDPAAAGDMVVRLSNFCRATLTRGEAQPQTLGDEIEVLRAYLGIEQARWADELVNRIEVDPATASRPLPPFLLLPLVENAVKYGSRTSPAVLEVHITVRSTPSGGMRITVANTGRWVPPSTAVTATSTGLGLENLRQRLQRHFPGAHSLAYEERDGWVTFTLVLTPASIAPPVPPCPTPAHSAP